MVKTVKKTKNRKTRQIVQHGQAHIKASFNNTIVTITDEKWNVLTWATGWTAWFKWSRESTPYAAQITAEQAVEKAKTLHSMESVDVYIKWIWIGREQAIRWLISNFEVNMNDFKNAFSRNYNLASKQFSKVIKEIDKTIDHLVKVKENLLKSDNNLRLANNKATDLSIKKLTVNSPSVAEEFENTKAKKRAKDQKSVI